MAVGIPHKGTYTRRFPSPLRYPGGKGKVANFVKLLLLENGLVGCEYVEPYAGGASVALSLLYEGYVDHIHINDLNRSVHAFWRTVLDEPGALCDRIRSTRVSRAQWNRQLAIQHDKRASTLDLAFSTFFLNRTSRSGIIGGGMIGGRRQDGPWKLDARYNKIDLITRVQRIARFKSRITLTGQDTGDYLRTVLPELHNAFVYLDPPYYMKGEGLYENFYNHEDHEEIASLVGTLTFPWIVSYDAVPQIEALYVGRSALSYDLAYSAGDRYRGSELMFFSDDLTVPRVDSVANIPFTAVDAARAAI